MFAASTLAQEFEWYWLGWIMLFVVLELWALYRGAKRDDDNDWQGGTLSELVWRTFKRSRWAQVILGAFMLVLGAHFMFAV